MNIFIDLDGTLYDTLSVQKGKTLAHLLLAELNAPLIENSKSAIENFCKNKHSCFITTSRGLLDDEEAQITKQRLKSDGFLNSNVDQSLLKGVAFYSKSKINAIKLIKDTENIIATVKKMLFVLSGIDVMLTPQYSQILSPSLSICE